MNDVPENREMLCDAQEARRKYKNNHRKNKRFIVTAAVSLIVIIALTVAVSIGVYQTFSSSDAVYRSTAQQLAQRSIESDNVLLSSKEKKLDSDWENSKSSVESVLNKYYADYQNGEISYTDITKIISAFSQLSNSKSICDEKLYSINLINDGRTSLEKVGSYLDNGKNLEALEIYLSIPEEDNLNYKDSLENAKEIRDKCDSEITYSVNGYLSRYKIDDAKNYISALISKLGDSDFLNSELVRIDEYNNFQNDLVDYSGDIEHIFTHCLIAFPELCYSSPQMTKSLDTDCVTPKEFKGMIQSIYEKGYILIDINLLIDETGESTKVAKLKLPRGKKPLVLSIDDVTYDSRKMHTGMVDKLILDENGRICSYTKNSDGSEIVSYDNEAFPIIDEFVRQHPDFSFRGARGTICNTGFDGVFGYRTQVEPKEEVDSEVERAEALKVAEAFKNEGWNFASHSYGHPHMSKISVEAANTDTDKWQNEVTSIIGKSKIMVWPYGDYVRSGAVHEHLYDVGFRLFCGVGSKPFIITEPDGLGIFMDRKPLDGYSLRIRHDSYLYLFDTYEVWDPLRPKEVTW